jgi:hypothetical protein
VTIPGQAPTVRNDGEVAFLLRGLVGHVVPVWGVEVVVAGQALESGPVAVHTRAPGVTAVAFDTPPNGTHYFLTLIGDSFGPVVSACADDVRVSVDGTPCASLTMVMVRERWLWVVAVVGCGWLEGFID